MSCLLLLAAGLVCAVSRFEFADIEVFSRDETVLDLNERAGIDDATFAIQTVPFLWLQTTFSDQGVESPLPFARCLQWLPAPLDREFFFLCDERHLLKVLFDWTTQETRGSPVTLSLPESLSCGPMFVSKPQVSSSFFVGCLDQEKRHVLLEVANELKLLQESKSLAGRPERRLDSLSISAVEVAGMKETRLYLFQREDPTLEFSYFISQEVARVEFVDTYSLALNNLVNCGENMRLANIINTRPDKNSRLFILLEDSRKLALHTLTRNPSRKWFECSPTPSKEIDKISPLTATTKYLPMDSLFTDVIVVAYPSHMQLLQVGSRGELDLEVGAVDLLPYKIKQILDVFYFGYNYYLVARTAEDRLLAVIHRRAYLNKHTEAKEFGAEYLAGFVLPSILDVGTADLFLLSTSRVKVTKVLNNLLIANFSDYNDSTAKVSVVMYGRGVEPVKQAMTAYVFQSFEDLKNEEMPAVVHLFENTRSFLLPSPFRGLMMSAGELKLVSNSLKGTVEVDFRLPRILKINFLIDVKGRWLSHFDSLVAINRNLRMAKCGRDIVFVECFEDDLEYNCLSLSSLEMDTADYELLEGFFFQRHYYIFTKTRHPTQQLEGIRVFRLDSSKVSAVVQTEFYPHDSILVDIRGAYGDSGFVFIAIAKTQNNRFGIFGMSILAETGDLPQELLLLRELPRYICPRRISIRDSDFVLTLDVASKCPNAPHIVYHFALSITRDYFNMTSLKSSHRAVLDRDFELCSQKNVMAMLYMAQPALFIHQTNVVTVDRDARTLAFPFGEGNAQAFMDYQCIESEQTVQILAKSVKNNTALVTVKMDGFENTEDRIYSVAILPSHVNRISTIIDYHDNGTIREFATIGLADSGKLNESVMIDVKDTWFQPFITCGKINHTASGEIEFEYSFQRNETKRKRVAIELNENVVYAQPVQRSKVREVLPMGSERFNLESLLFVKGHYVRSALTEAGDSLALADRFSSVELYESLPYKFNSLIIHHKVFFGATDRDLILMSNNNVIFKDSCKATNLRMIHSADNTPTFFATFESLKQATLTNLVVIYWNATEHLWHRETLPLPFRDIASFRVSSWDLARAEYIYVAQAESLGFKQLECSIVTISNNSVQVVGSPLEIPFFHSVIDFTSVPVHNRSLVLVVSLSKSRELEFIYLFRHPSENSKSLRFRRQRYLPCTDYLGNITKIAASRLDKNRSAIYTLVVPEFSSVFYSLRFELDLSLDSQAVVLSSHVENRLASIDGFEPQHLIIHDDLAIIFYNNNRLKNSTLLHREEHVIAVYHLFGFEFALKVFCSNNLDPGATSLDGSSVRSPNKFVANFNDPPSRFVFDTNERTEVLGFMVNDLQTRLRSFATFNINNLSLEVLSSFKVNETLKKAVLYVYDIDYKPHKLPLERLFQTSPNHDLKSFWDSFILLVVAAAVLLLLGVAGILLLCKRLQRNRKRSLTSSGRYTEGILEEENGPGDSLTTNRTLRGGARFEEQDTAQQIKL